MMGESIELIALSLAERIEQVARLAHETNRAYCQNIGDDSQPPWEDAPDWQKTSALNGVRFHMDHPGSHPENSHANWLKQKIAEGWTYGPVKDPERKQHPCCVPYGDLPESQKTKDALFMAVVGVFLPGLRAWAEFERGNAVDRSVE